MQVCDEEGKQLFGLHGDELQWVNKGTLEDDNKLAAWVHQHYGDVIADLTEANVQ